ncbi:MAG: insulinase family protein [Gemmatimonadetes bacterium]|nr:insulinase family protein [Gemmatimonadota bacterium]
MADLSAASLDDVKDFFRRYYAPNNAVIVVAGAVRSDSVRAARRQAFGDIPRGPAITRPAPAAFTVRDTVLVAEDQVQLPRLYLAWRSVPQYHADDAALNVARMVLSGARNARLTNALIYEQEVAKDVFANNDSKKLDGDFSITATARPGVTLNVLKGAIDKEIRRLATDGPTARELEAGAQRHRGRLPQPPRVRGRQGRAAQRSATTTRDAGLLPARSRSPSRRHRRRHQARRHPVPHRPRVMLSIVPKGKQSLAATREGRAMTPRIVSDSRNARPFAPRAPGLRHPAGRRPHQLGARSRRCRSPPPARRTSRSCASARRR